jgi:hypothetical protein
VAGGSEDPSRLRLVGFRWTAEEVRAFGRSSYGATKQRMERCYFRVRGGGLYAKIDGIDGDAINSVAADAPAPLTRQTGGGGLSLAAFAPAAIAARLRREAAMAAADADADEEEEEADEEEACTTTATLLDEAQLKRCMRAVFYYRRRREEDVRLEAVSFADAWITDRNARTLEGLVFDPSRAPGPFQVGGRGGGGGGWAWNNWPGIRAAGLPALARPQPAEAARAVDAGLARICAHITEVLFSGDGAHGEWCLDYLAVIVKRPW